MSRIVSTRNIPRLAYWRFVRLEKCLLSGAFPEFVNPKFEIEAPSSRAQASGIIFHTVMEKINKWPSDKPLSGEEFGKLFDQVLLNYQTTEIDPDPKARHLGNIRLWPEIADTYRVLVDFIRKERDPAPPGSKVFSEAKLQTKDGLLTGILDAYFQRPNGIRLVDYKRGVILHEGSPKQDYVRQLYFYAQLIFENHSTYPKSLALIDGELKSTEVQPSPEGSDKVAREMRSLLATYNEKVKEGLPPEKMANPSDEACSFCDAKPFCPAFWQSLGKISLKGKNHIVEGKQDGDIVVSAQSAATLKLKDCKGSIDQGQLSVARFFSKKYPEFINVPGQRIVITNLHYDEKTAPGIASMTDRSQVMRLGVSDGE